MRRAVKFCLLFGLLLYGETPDRPRLERWHEDLKAFADFLHGTNFKRGSDTPPGQKDLEKLYPNLDADLAEIERDVPKLRDAEIPLRLARVMAGAHVAHNSLDLSAPLLPLSIRWVTDGAIVTAATSDYKEAIGAQIVKVGGLAPDELLGKLSPYISTETEGWKRIIAENWVRNRALLEMLGVAHDGRLDFELATSTGTKVLSVALAVAANAKQITIAAAAGRPIGLAWSKPEGSYYWSVFLPDSKAFYIQYNKCADDPKQPFSQFAKSVLGQIDEDKATRIIVDLRFNTGGNSEIIRPLIEGLAARRKAIGAPYVLIGPATFSSGVMGASRLRQQTKAKLVGEPTGGLEGGYGESPSRMLPNSKLAFQWTIKYFGSKRELLPDIPVAVTTKDLRAGVDAVLDAALASRR